MISPEVIDLFEDNGITEEDLAENETMFFDEKAYDSAILGISSGWQAVYDHELMVLGLMNTYGITKEDALDWIDYNTLRSLDYIGCSKKPIVLYGFRGYERI